MSDGPSSLFNGEAVTGRELEYLFAPLDAGDCIREYWGRRPLHVRGHARKYAHVFDRERFDRAVANARPKDQDSKIFVRANFARGFANTRAKLDPFTITPEQAPSILAAGGSICVNWINEADPKLDLLARALKAQLGHAGPARFNAYLSPESGGARMHFDARVVTTLQVEGTKVWRVSRTPAVAWPKNGAVIDADFDATYIHNDDHRLQLDKRRRSEWEVPAPVSAADFEDITLEPGDLLMLPAGTWHSPQAQRGDSLAINFACDPLSFGSLVADVLDDALGHLPEWRAVPPLFGAGPNLPTELRGYLAARLREAASLLEQLAPDGQPMCRALGRHIVPPRRARASGDAATTEDSRVNGEGIAPGDLFQLPKSSAVLALLCREDGEHRRMLLFSETSETDIAPQLVPFVSAMLSARTFRAADCREWTTLSWPLVQEILSTLCSIGVLEQLPEVSP